MSASYFGTFPVKRELNTGRTMNGVRTASMSIVDKEDNITAHLPVIGSEYEYDTSLWITSANLSYSGNGLAEVTISAAGPSTDASPRVFLAPGAPLIYGLSPGVATQSSGLPLFSQNGGQSVEVSFCDIVGNQENLISTYYRLPMPSSVGGVSLPVPARSPGPITPVASTARVPVPDPFGGNQPPGSNPPEFTGYYGGFVCTDLIMQPEGRALVVRAIFKETGWVTAGSGTVFYFN